MKEFFKKNWWMMLLGVGMVSELSYVFSGLASFWKVFNILIPVLGGIFLWKYEVQFKVSKKDDEKDVAFQELVGAFQEQSDILDEYEKIFDAQLVEVPCICGETTFQGLFSPKLENIVECEKCNNKYRVTVDYNSVLISEPLDLNQKFDELVGKVD